jgi:hypothetical protein
MGATSLAKHAKIGRSTVYKLIKELEISSPNSEIPKLTT